MIVSHKHKFIFLKTKKTAGTAIEAAISQLCGSDDVITPYREASEQERKGLGPQNYRIEHPLKPKRSLWRRVMRRPERYYHPTVGYYEHMPWSLVRAYVGEDVWKDYYKFAFDRNPWPSFARFMSSRRRAYVDNHEIYMRDGALVVDFLGRYESLEEDLNAALAAAGVKQRIDVPKVNVTPNKDRARDYRSYYSDELRDLVARWYAPEIKLLRYEF